MIGHTRTLLAAAAIGAASAASAAPILVIQTGCDVKAAKAAQGQGGPGAAAAKPKCGALAKAVPREIDLPWAKATIVFRGYVQFDAASYQQAPQGSLATDFRRGSVGAPPNSETEDASDLASGVLWRRARIGADGTFQNNWTYRAMFELGGSGRLGQARLAEVWASYNRFAPFTIQAGAFAPPANLDDRTSPENTLFLERASAAEISRALGGGDGRLGVTLKLAEPRWLAAVSLTGPKLGQVEKFDVKGAIVGRMTHVLYRSKDDLVHIGASGTYVLDPNKQSGTSGATTEPIRFRIRAEIAVDSTRLIDTGNIDAAHASVYGLEFAVQHRNFFVQSEVFRYEIQRREPTTLSDPRFAGYYLQGSWVLTGERRRYNTGTGSFQNPLPSKPLGQPGGWGAWELALRFSRMDLNYDQGIAGLPPPPDGVRGGDQRIVTLGLNWYPTAKMKLMFDAMYVSVNRLNPASPLNPQPFGPPPDTPPVGVQIGQNMTVFAVRGQYVF